MRTERELHAYGVASIEIRRGAKKAGHEEVEFVEPKVMRELFGTVRAPGVCIGREIFPIHILSNVSVDLRSNRGKAYGHTTVARSTLEKTPVQFFYVAPAGYGTILLIIPSEDLMALIFPSTYRNASRQVYIPLEHEPEDPVFPFWDYRNNWSAIQY